MAAVCVRSTLSQKYFRLAPDSNDAPSCTPLVRKTGHENLKIGHAFFAKSDTKDHRHIPSKATNPSTDKNHVLNFLVHPLAKPH